MTQDSSKNSKTGFVGIKNIQSHITAKFQKLKYPIATIKYDLPILDTFAVDNARKLNLSVNEALERARDVWFAMASVQLSVGYMLVAVDSAKFPRGIKQTAYDIKDLETDMNIGDLHFWYHHNLAIECVYRVWERLSNMLKYFCSIEENEGRLYFDGTVLFIKNLTHYSNLPSFNNLSKHIRHWNKVAGERNSISHQGCRLFGNDKVNEIVLPITKFNGSKFKRLETEPTDLYQSIDNVKNKYKQCMAGVEHTMNFINDLPNN